MNQHINKSEQGQGLVELALGFTVLVILVTGAYFLFVSVMNYYHTVQAPEITFESRAAVFTLSDFMKDPSRLASGEIYRYGDTQWQCEGGNMYFTSRLHPTKDFFVPGCPNDVPGFKKAMQEIKRLVMDAINKKLVPPGVDSSLLLRTIDDILHWL